VTINFWQPDWAKKKRTIPDGWSVLPGGLIGKTEEPPNKFECQLIKGGAGLKDLCVGSGLITELAWQNWQRAITV
jgi:hypothetical protein